MVKWHQIIGSVIRARSISEKAEVAREFQRNVLPLFVKRVLVPMIWKTYPLEAAAAAHQAMERSSHFGKIVLNI